jgi:hypothetical protein
MVDCMAYRAELYGALRLQNGFSKHHNVRFAA